MNVSTGKGKKQTPPSSDSQVLNAEAKKFLDYSRDFLGMQKEFIDEILATIWLGTLTRSPATIMNAFTPGKQQEDYNRLDTKEVVRLLKFFALRNQIGAC